MVFTFGGLAADPFPSGGAGEDGMILKEKNNIPLGPG